MYLKVQANLSASWRASLWRPARRTVLCRRPCHGPPLDPSSTGSKWRGWALPASSNGRNIVTRVKTTTAINMMPTTALTWCQQPTTALTWCQSWANWRRRYFIHGWEQRQPSMLLPLPLKHAGFQEFHYVSTKYECFNQIAVWYEVANGMISSQWENEVASI